MRLDGKGQDDAGQEGHGDEVDHGQLRVDAEGHEGGGDHHQRAADEHADHHHHRVLYEVQVGGHAGDEGGGAEVIRVGEGKVLDLVEEGFAQVADQTGGGKCRKTAGTGSEEQGDD